MKRSPAPAQPIPENERLLVQARQHHEAGDLAAAETGYRTLLARKPNHAETLFLLGTLCVQRSAHAEAVALLECVLALQPRHDGALYNLGLARQNAGAHTQAISCFERLAVRAPSADVWNNLGVSRQAVGLLDEARAAYRQALALNAAHLQAVTNLAGALNELDEPLQAETFARAALKKSPDHAPAHNHLAASLRAQGRRDEARVCLDRALALRPGYAEAWFNLGILHQDRNELSDALHCYEKAISLTPDDADAHLNRASVLLLEGDFARGWVEYDWRFMAHRTPRRPLPWPPWDGSPLDGKRLLIQAEQGVGDEIMFASCFPELLRTTRRCVIECDRRLVPLFERSFPGAEIVGGKVEKGIREDTTARLTARGPFDFQAAMGDLPRHLRPDLLRFPRHDGYLRADPQRVAKWQQRYAALGSGPKIGISWRGGRTGVQRQLRSLALADWGEILAIPGVHFVNLQYGDTRADRQSVRTRLGVDVRHWEDSNPLVDLDDFAAQITALDLVISIDNATVHLAGALGVATWVMLPFSPDWRWMLGRDDTPWYPSIQLCRQPAPEAWSPVLARVAARLATRS